MQGQPASCPACGLSSTSTWRTGYIWRRLLQPYLVRGCGVLFIRARMSPRFSRYERCLCVAGGSSARSIGESSVRRSLQQASAQCGNQGYIIGESYCVTVGELCRLLRRNRCIITQRSSLQHAALSAIASPVTAFYSNQPLASLLQRCCQSISLPFKVADGSGHC